MVALPPMRAVPLLTLVALGWTRAASAQTVTHDHDAPHAVVPSTWDMNDADDVLQRMQQVATGDPVTAARAISAALLHGVEPRVAAFGLHALAALGRQEGTQAVTHFLEHRRPTLRRHAIAAAMAIGGTNLARAVEARVSDPDPDVRGDAAMALGEMRDRAAMSTLWAALDRDLGASLEAQGSALIRGCAHGIARLGNDAEVDRLVGYLRRAPLRALTEAFEIALGRSDLPDPVKTRIVSAVGGLATPDAREFLLRVSQPRPNAPRASWVELARASAQRIQAGGAP